MVVNPDETSERRTRLEALFASHYGELTRFASRRVGPDAAADVVSATFLAAWRRLDEVPSEQARAWLYATARHVITNEARSRQRRDRLGDRVGRTTATATDDPSDEVTDRVRVRSVLDRLSVRDQEVLRLTEWEQLSVAEAARVMGCTTTALKVRLHRARRRFSTLLQNDDLAESAITPDLETSQARQKAALPEGK